MCEPVEDQRKVVQRILVSPELTDILSAMVSRLRTPNGAIPLNVAVARPQQL